MKRSEMKMKRMMMTMNDNDHDDPQLHQLFTLPSLGTPSLRLQTSLIPR